MKQKKEAWQAFLGVVDGFLGNKKDPNYKEIVKKLIKSYQNMGCRMSVKLHFLYLLLCLVWVVIVAIFIRALQNTREIKASGIKLQNQLMILFKQEIILILGSLWLEP